MIFGFFKQDKPDLTEELKRIQARNDARFKAVKERMQAEGKHTIHAQWYFTWDLTGFLYARRPWKVKS